MMNALPSGRTGINVVPARRIFQAFIEFPKEKKRRKQKRREEKRRREKKCRLDKSEAVISVQGDGHQSINQSIKHTYLTHMIHNIPFQPNWPVIPSIHPYT